MVVEAQVMVYDRVVCMVGFEQVLEGSRPLLGGCLDVVDFYGWDRGLEIVAASEAQKGWD
jgi:hypothetical protein